MGGLFGGGKKRPAPKPVKVNKPVEQDKEERARQADDEERRRRRAALGSTLLTQQTAEGDLKKDTLG